MTSCWPWRTQSTQPYMHTESELALGQLDLLNARCVKQDPDQVIAKASSLPAFKRFDAVSCFHAVPCDLVAFDSLLLGPDAFICSRKRAQKQGSLLAESAEGCQSCDKTGFGMFSKKTQHTHTHSHSHILHHFAVLFLVHQHSQVWLSTKYQITQYPTCGKCPCWMVSSTHLLETWSPCFFCQQCSTWMHLH